LLTYNLSAKHNLVKLFVAARASDASSSGNALVEELKKVDNTTKRPFRIEQIDLPDSQNPKEIGNAIVSLWIVHVINIFSFSLSLSLSLSLLSR